MYGERGGGGGEVESHPLRGPCFMTCSREDSCISDTLSKAIFSWNSETKAYNKPRRIRSRNWLNWNERR